MVISLVCIWVIHSKDLSHLWRIVFIRHFVRMASCKSHLLLVIHLGGRRHVRVWAHVILSSDHYFFHLGLLVVDELGATSAHLRNVLLTILSIWILIVSWSSWRLVASLQLWWVHCFQSCMTAKLACLHFTSGCKNVVVSHLCSILGLKSGDFAPAKSTVVSWSSAHWSYLYGI